MRATSLPKSRPDKRRHSTATVIPSVAYTHPEVAWVGVTEDQAKREARSVEVAKFPWAASGRAIANGADYGFTKLIFDSETHRVIGGTIVGPAAGDMIGEVALSHRNGLRCSRYRQDDPPAPDTWRKHWHGSRNRPRKLHRRAASTQTVASRKAVHFFHQAARAAVRGRESCPVFLGPQFFRCTIGQFPTDALFDRYNKKAPREALSV